MCIPDDWRHAWLVFISKPHKNGHSPSDFRPIALSSPIGKALLGIIQRRLRPYMVREMSHFPQWAYLPSRGVNQALALMYSPCQRVTEAVRAQQLSLYDKKAGARRVELCGGLILSVDLRSAFDKLTHASMEQALALTDIPEELQFLIRLWHHNMQYHTTFADQPRSFKAQQGVRQGCKVSPYVWLLFTKLVMTKVNAALGPEWCQRFYSAYADDQLIRAELSSPAELEALLRGIGCVLDVLEALGMELSPGKSLAVLTLTQAPAPKSSFVVAPSR